MKERNSDAFQCFLSVRGPGVREISSTGFVAINLLSALSLNFLKILLKIRAITFTENARRITHEGERTLLAFSLTRATLYPHYPLEFNGANLQNISFLRHPILNRELFLHTVKKHISFC